MKDWNKEIMRATDRLAEAAAAVIRKDGKKKSKPYCVYSEKTGRNFGCYATRKQAEERIAQMKEFKSKFINDDNE